MTRKLHTRSRIFFPNPHVIRIEYPGETLETVFTDFRKLCKNSYTLIKGTWGHSPLLYETHVTLERPSISTPYDYTYTPRAYFCFKHDADALHFRLSLKVQNIQVKMWPKSAEYTIHEYIED